MFSRTELLGRGILRGLRLQLRFQNRLKAGRKRLPGNHPSHLGKCRAQILSTYRSRCIRRSPKKGRGHFQNAVRLRVQWLVLLSCADSRWII